MSTAPRRRASRSRLRWTSSSASSSAARDSRSCSTRPATFRFAPRRRSPAARNSRTWAMPRAGRRRSLRAPPPGPGRRARPCHTNSGRCRGRPPAYGRCRAARRPASSRPPARSCGPPANRPPRAGRGRGADRGSPCPAIIHDRGRRASLRGPDPVTRLPMDILHDALGFAARGFIVFATIALTVLFCVAVLRRRRPRGSWLHVKPLNKQIEALGGALRVNLMKRRSEEHTSELQSRLHLVCRLLLEKKKKKKDKHKCDKQTA